MKKIYSNILLLLTLAFYSNAQEIEMKGYGIPFANNKIYKKMYDRNPSSRFLPAANKAQGDTTWNWMCYADAVGNNYNGEVVSNQINGLTLWPDSLVVFTSTTGNFNWYYHGYASVFDPNSKFYEKLYNTTITDDNSYLIDSIAFFYSYDRIQDSLPQTDTTFGTPYYKYSLTVNGDTVSSISFNYDTTYTYYNYDSVLAIYKDSSANTIIQITKYDFPSNPDSIDTLLSVYPPYNYFDADSNGVNDSTVALLADDTLKLDSVQYTPVLSINTIYVKPVDTLKVFIISASDLDYSSNGPYYFPDTPLPGDSIRFGLVSYDYITNKPSGSSITEYKILLTEADTTGGFLSDTAIAISKLNIAKGKKVGIAFSFLPGNKNYSLGDTLLDQVNSFKVMKNLFQLATYEELEGAYPLSYLDDIPNPYVANPIQSRNETHVLTTDVRYNISTNGWNGVYIPSFAYSDPYRYEHAFNYWHVAGTGAFYDYGTTNGRTVDFQDKSNINPVSWSWDYGDGSLKSTDQNPSHTFAKGDTVYKACLTAKDAAGASYKHCKYIKTQWGAGTEEDKLLKAVKIYPNPANSAVNIDLNSETEKNAKVSLYNVIGDCVLEVNLSHGSNATVQLDVSPYPPGVYMLRLQTDNMITTRKITIVK